MADRGFLVRIEGTDNAVLVMPDEPILDGAERAGLILPHDCRGGGCGTCRIRLLEGTVRYEEFPLALTPEEADAGYALACQALPASDLVIGLPAPPTAPEPERHQAVVRWLRPVTAEILHLAVALPERPDLDFLPGQYMNVVLEGGATRSFSMASAPGAPVLDFYLRRIPDGRFTDHRAARLREGMTLEVELPLGSFRYHAEDDRPLLMVATGTGLAPLKSILEALRDDPDCPPVTLYWGMRTEADLFLQRDITGWAGRLPEFRYVPVLSRPGPGWAGRRGYVQDAIAADLPELSDHAIYLCGSPQMIADAKRSFMAAAASPAHIYAEGFTFQHEAGQQEAGG